MDFSLTGKRGLTSGGGQGRDWRMARALCRRGGKRCCGLVSDLGFRVWGLGFGVWGLGFGVWGLGFGVWGCGFWVLGLGV